MRPSAPCSHQIADSALVGFAAMLRPDLHDQFARQNGIARCLGLLQIVGHGLLAIGVLAGFGGHPEMRRVLEIGGGDDDRIHVFGRQQIVQVLKGEGRPAVFVRGGLGRSLAIHVPQIADGDHFDVVTRFESGHNRRKFAAAIADTDVTEAGYARSPRGFERRISPSRPGARALPEARTSGSDFREGWREWAILLGPKVTLGRSGNG